MDKAFGLYPDKFQTATAKTVFWLTDSMNLVRFLTKGSGKLDILRMTLRGIEKAKGLNVDLVPIWARRSDPRLLKADAGSKGTDTDSWELPADVYADLVIQFGQFTVDLFADHKNAKCEKFYSRNWHPASAQYRRFVLHGNPRRSHYSQDERN